MLSCPGCGGPAEGARCHHCGTNLEEARREALVASARNLKPLPLYHEGEAQDVENLCKLASFVGWTNLFLTDHYSICPARTMAEDKVYVSILGVRDVSDETVEVADIPAGVTMREACIGPDSCLVHSVTATANAYGQSLVGELREDGWHGTLGEAIEIANQTVRAKAQAVRGSSEYRNRKLYPKEMWR